MYHWCDGLCLHHLCDWVVTLRRYKSVIHDNENLDLHFRNVLQVFTEFSNRYLGTQVKLDAYSAELFELLMDDLFRSKYQNRPISNNKWSILVFKMKSNVHRLRVRCKVLGQSVVFTLLNTVYIHLKYSKRIFRFH